VQLPTNPVDRQTIKIVAVAPITTTNVWATNSIGVRYVPLNRFASGNTVVKLTYLQSSGYWVIS